MKAEVAYNLRSRKIHKTLKPHPSRNPKIHTTLKPHPSCNPKKEVCTGNRFGAEIPWYMSGDPKFVAFSLFDGKKCVPWAEKALEHYNSKECARFELVEIGAVMFGYAGEKELDHMNFALKELVHMNFTAKSTDSASTELFYAEVYIVWDMEDDTEVKGCCLLEKAESVDRSFQLCSICLKGVIHPGPAYGYRRASGDDFPNSLFLKKNEFLWDPRVALSMSCGGSSAAQQHNVLSVPGGLNIKDLS